MLGSIANEAIVMNKIRLVICFIEMDSELRQAGRRPESDLLFNKDIVVIDWCSGFWRLNTQR